MPNNFLNTNWVSMQILRMLLNKLVVLEYFDKSWNKEFAKEFAVGAQIQVKFPQRFIASEGMAYNPDDINRLSTMIALDRFVKVHFEWDDYEQAVRLERSEEELKENYFDPAAAALSQEWDSIAAQYAYQNASQIATSVANPNQLGVNPAVAAIYHQARQHLMEEGNSEKKRAVIISSSMMGAIGGAITNLIHPGDEITRAFKEGYLGRLAGADFFESQSLWRHLAGTFAGGPVVVTGANQTGNQLVITPPAGSNLNVGDKFSIANVNKVNPMTRRVSGPLTARHFTCLTPVVGAGAPVTINIRPAIWGPGSQYQNVDALPANGPQLTLWPGTAVPNGAAGTVGFLLTRIAFMFVGAKLYLPKAVEDKGYAQDPDSGLTVRKVTVWDEDRSALKHRMDTLGGFGSGYTAEGAAIIAGA